MTAATGVLFYDPISTPISTLGTLQPGAYRYFYSTGTTTQTNVYADGYLDEPLTQPVTANSAGQFTAIYLDPTVTYRCQLYSSAGVLLEDIDPYVPQPTSATVASLLASIASINAELATLTSEIAALQTAIAWSTITGVPTPLITLGASTPPDSGATFWCDNGTWSTPNLTGTSVTVSAPSDVSAIGSTFTTVVGNIPVSAGHTYAMLFEGDVISSGAGSIATQMLPNSGVLVQVGGALGFNLQTGSGAYQQINGNAAIPGVSGQPIYSGDDNYLQFRGRFEVPTGCTAVSFQLKVPSGTITAKAGCYVTLTQIA